MSTVLKVLNIMTLAHIVLGIVIGINNWLALSAIATVFANITLFIYDELRSGKYDK
ncbi:MAG: hypothetical protein ACRCX2_34635 [Paraclostridium sp.]